MDACKKHKRVVKRNLVRLKEQILVLQSSKTLNFENLSKLEAVLCDYKKLKLVFENVVDEMLSLADETEATYATWESELMKEVTEIADVVYTCEGKIKNFHKTISLDETRDSLLPSAGASNLNKSFLNSQNSKSPKLKKIDVPEFDGDILKFDSFRRLFENLIHNSEELTNVQKLYYLKNSLTGPAAEIIRDFSLDDRSYSEAWSYILTRYDNPRSVIKSLFRKLINLKQIKSDVEIRGLLDQVDIVIRGLKATGENIDPTFSRFIAFFVTSKLDSMSARDFENSIATIKSHPTYEELRAFLQIRSFVAEDCNPNPKLKSTLPLKSSIAEKKIVAPEKKVYSRRFEWS